MPVATGASGSGAGNDEVLVTCEGVSGASMQLPTVWECFVCSQATCHWTKTDVVLQVTRNAIVVVIIAFIVVVVTRAVVIVKAGVVAMIIVLVVIFVVVLVIVIGVVS